MEDVSEGDRVIASAYAEDDGTYTAQKVLVKADNSVSATRHILGVVLDSGDGYVSLQDNDGNTLSILVPEGVAVPEAGTVVTAIVQVDGSTGNLTARAFDLAEDAVQRLQKATDEATDEETREDLEQRLENARDQHLTTLEKARIALERARQAAETEDPDDAERAQARLQEVEQAFTSVRQRYEQEATERDERLPELRITGSIRYGEAAWEQQSGVFNLAIDLGDSIDDSAVRAFTWDASTMAIVPLPVEPDDSDSVTALQSADVAPSVSVPLNSVKSLIPNGSRVIVQYDPNSEPPKATLVTLLPPELPAAIEEALRQEQLRNFTGFVTLVEETPDLDAVLGVVVVASSSGDKKVAAKVTETTKIEIDGQTATLSDLAAGMAAEVAFDVVQPTEDDASLSSVDGRLNATRIRARTVVDEKETHIAGVITNIDEGARSVTIKPVDGAAVTLDVTEDTAIVKDGQPARFSVLEMGDLVLDATRYNRETLALTRLVAQSPRELTFTGSVTGKNRNPGRITVTTANGDVILVYITDETKISSELAGSITFSDIEVGDRVLKGTALPVERGDTIVNVATELFIGTARIATARGIVRSSDIDSGELVIVVNAASAADSSQIMLTIPKDPRPIMFKNGEQIKTIASVNVGDIVESVSYNASTGAVIKLSVVSPNIQRVRGTVVEVAGDSLSMSSANGRNISLTVVDETQVTLNGRSVDSLEKVNAGDTVAQAVYIALNEDFTRGVAVQLVLNSAIGISTVEPGGTPGPSTSNASVIETSVSGVLTDVEGRVWAIGSRRFRVTESTQFFGATPAVGLVAKATLQTRDGELVAVAISVAGRPDTDPSTRPAEIKPAEPSDGSGEDTSDGLVRVSGRVREIEREGDEVLAVVIDSVKIVTTADTKMFGEPNKDVLAVAVVRRESDGTVTAISIAFGNSRDSSVGVATPTPTPTPTPTVTATPSDTPTDQDNGQVRVVVEEVSGRIVLANGRLYLLSLSQSTGVKKGDTLSLTVREVAIDDLTALQLAVVTANPLYAAQSASATVSSIYVAS